MKMTFATYGFFFLMSGGLLCRFAGAQSTARNEARAPFAVVELFTSEGCSSCPPAEEYLNDLVLQARAKNQKIYPLAFHVDYWNNLGWQDVFSHSRFSERQRDYARSANSSRIYTPQMIINGEVALVGSDKDKGELAIAQALLRPAAVEINLQADLETSGKIILTYKILPMPEPPCVLNFSLVERGLRREIRSGENNGRVLYHDNVVRAFESSSPHNSSVNRVIMALPSDLVLYNSSVIAYAQNPNTMHILGATGIDF